MFDVYSPSERERPPAAENAASPLSKGDKKGLDRPEDTAFGVGLGSLAAGEVQTSVKFQNSLSRLWGEGGQRPGEGAGTNGDAPSAASRLLATAS